LAEVLIFLPILLCFISYQFFKGKKQNRTTLLALNIVFLIVWLFCAWVLQIVIDVFIFDWTEAGQNLFDKLEKIIGGILIYVPWYMYSWYLWGRRPKNSRFKLKKDEKILFLKPRAYWINIRHLTNFGTIYFTDKRIVFCATAGWKLFFAGPLIDPTTKSANIRWEAGYNRVGIVDGKGIFFRVKFMTLDGKNTGIALEEDFIDLLNTFKGS
tara:strand:+ start:1615 stop:2250 length:636 start_codon:yes stop_codon:yes gene_type:complete